LAPGAHSTDILNNIVNHIEEVTANNNYNNFFHQPVDPYKLEVSFIYRQEEQTLILILHVPFVETEHLLPLYEFISLSFHFNFSANISVIPEVGRAYLIAICETETFQTLSSSDLASCKGFGLLGFPLLGQLATYQGQLQIPDFRHKGENF
jgi:hypothetical protein